MNGIDFGNPARSVAITPCSSKVEQGAFFSAGGGYMVAGESSNSTQTQNTVMWTY